MTCQCGHCENLYKNPIGDAGRERNQSNSEVEKTSACLPEWGPSPNAGICNREPARLFFDWTDVSIAGKNRPEIPDGPDDLEQ
jgi:hypothetical protein